MKIVKNQTTLSKKEWAKYSEISDQTNLFEYLLKQQNLEEKEISKFLSPSLDDLHDPMLMSGMTQAVKRIQKAIEENERIMVYGDFDTDGITSTVILTQGLRDLGGNISYRIPCRVKDSHGLKKELIDEIASKEVSLLITCDCGINEYIETQYATEKGIDVIITDHHDPDPERFPETALAVLNPLQYNCNYPCKTLAGAGVAFKLIQALSISSPLNLSTFLPIAAIGLVADCVPLTGETRTIAKLGLKQLQNSQWEGLQKLLDFTDTDPNEINETTVGFTIGPRLNAASRIGDVTRAVELFLGDPVRHDERIQYLESLNEQRKQKTEETLAHAMTQLDENRSCQILYAPEWEQGILGLIGGRLCEKLDQPIIALRKTETGSLAASCRAPEGCNMIEALRSVDSLLGKYGGHDGAAGFEIQEKNISDLKKELDKHFKSQERIIPPLNITTSISGELVNEEVANFLNTLAPFGIGNPAPIFCFENVQILEKSWMGKSEMHFKIQGMKDHQIFEFLVFFRPEWFADIQPEKSVNIAFNINESYWRGERQIKLKLVDIMMQEQQQEVVVDK